MSLTYKSKRRTRERILAFGAQGTGKTVAPLQIARRCPDAKFYVIDVDYNPSFELYLDGTFTDVEERFDVTPVEPEDWQGLLAAIDRAKELVTRDDWIVVDSFSHSWNAVQHDFIHRIYAKGMDEYFMEVREKKERAKGAKGEKAKSLGALEGWLDWPVINNNYFPLYGKLATTIGHVYLTAESGRLSDDDDKEVRGRFGPYGVKPVGQKKFGFWPHTVLLLSKSRAGEYSVSTVKDRDRDEVEDLEVTDFFKDYMVKIAGWRPVKTTPAVNEEQGE